MGGAALPLALIASAGAGLWGAQSQAGAQNTNTQAAIDFQNRMQSLIFSQMQSGQNPYAQAMQQFMGFPAGTIGSPSPYTPPAGTPNPVQQPGTGFGPGDLPPDLGGQTQPPTLPPTVPTVPSTSTSPAEPAQLGGYPAPSPFDFGGTSGMFSTGSFGGMPNYNQLFANMRQSTLLQQQAQQMMATDPSRASQLLQQAVSLAPTSQQGWGDVSTFAPRVLDANGQPVAAPTSFTPQGGTQLTDQFGNLSDALRSMFASQGVQVYPNGTPVSGMDMRAFSPQIGLANTPGTLDGRPVPTGFGLPDGTGSTGGTQPGVPRMMTPSPITANLVNPFWAQTPQNVFAPNVFAAQFSMPGMVSAQQPGAAQMQLPGALQGPSLSASTSQLPGAVGAEATDPFNILSRAGFNTGQDALMQMFRASPQPSMDPSLSLNLQRQGTGADVFDNSALFQALGPMDQRLIDQQVNQLRAQATSLGQLGGGAMMQNEANLRRDLSESIMARNAGIQQQSFEAARNRGLQASGLQAQLLGQQNQFGLGAYNAQLQAAQGLSQAALGGAGLGLQGGLTGNQLALQAALANQQAALSGGQFNAGQMNQMALQQAQLGLQTGLANQQTALAGGQFNVGQQNQMLQFGAGQSLQAALANQAMQQGMTQFGAQQQNAMTQFGAQQQLQAMLANQGTGLSMNQFNAGLVNQLNQFNAGNQMQAQMANQAQANAYNNFIMQGLSGANAMQQGQYNLNSQLLGLLAGVPVPTMQASPWPGAVGDIASMAMLYPFLQRMSR